MKKVSLELYAVFCIGALSYGLIEVIERGYSHITMGVLGGLSMVSIHLLNDDRRHGGSVIRLLLISSFFITALELLAGEILNVYLEMDIWCYSGQALNFDGVICPYYTGYWLLLSLLGMIVDDLVRWRLFHQKLYLHFFRSRLFSKYSLGNFKVKRSSDLDV